MRSLRLGLFAFAAAIIGSSIPGVGAEDTFSIIVLPDTQWYSQSYPDSFHAQTRWIVENRAARNIQFVAHEGDVVQRGSRPEQYEVADKAMRLLDGVVPYGVLPGNHDGGGLFSNYFGAERYKNYPWYCGTAFSRTMRLIGSCQVFSAGGDDYVVLHLGWMPQHELLAPLASLAPEPGSPGVTVNNLGLLRWAHERLQQYASRRAILVFHAYLTRSGDRRAGYDTVFELLVKPNPNVFLVMNGHELGRQAEALRIDKVEGRPILQMLANYQDRQNGGDGWLRILTFNPKARTMKVETYSATLDRFETDSNSDFEVSLDTGEIRAGGVVQPQPLSAPSNLRIVRPGESRR